MSNLKSELDFIMQKIDAMDPALDDYEGSPEDLLRKQALALLANDPESALRYFEECGAEHFDYFLGFLPDLSMLASFDEAQENRFMEEMEKIANKKYCHSKHLKNALELLQYRAWRDCK